MHTDKRTAGAATDRPYKHWSWGLLTTEDTYLHEWAGEKIGPQINSDRRRSRNSRQIERMGAKFSHRCTQINTDRTNKKLIIFYCKSLLCVDRFPLPKTRFPVRRFLGILLDSNLYYPCSSVCICGHNSSMVFLFPLPDLASEMICANLRHLRTNSSWFVGLRTSQSHSHLYYLCLSV